MKYTPQELLWFVKEEKLEEKLKNAIGNNGRDYHLYPTEGELKTIGGEMCYAFQPEGVVEPLALKEYCTPDQIKILCADPQCIHSALTFHDGNIGFVITFSPDKSEEEQEAEFWDHVYLDLFRTMGIDTHGKVRRFIEDAAGSSSDGIRVYHPTAVPPQR